MCGVRPRPTRDQNPQLQLDALQASGYDTMVQEMESAKRGRPPWFVRENRPHLFVTCDRTRRSAKLMFSSSDRT